MDSVLICTDVNESKMKFIHTLYITPHLCDTQSGASSMWLYLKARSPAHLFLAMIVDFLWFYYGKAIVVLMLKEEITKMKMFSITNKYKYKGSH